MTSVYRRVVRRELNDEAVIQRQILVVRPQCRLKSRYGIVIAGGRSWNCDRLAQGDPAPPARPLGSDILIALGSSPGVIGRFAQRLSGSAS